MGRWVNLGEYLCCGGQKTAELHNSPVVLYILSEGKIADFYGFSSNCTVSSPICTV